MVNTPTSPFQQSTSHSPTQSYKPRPFTCNRRVLGVSAVLALRARELAIISCIKSRRSTSKQLQLQRSELLVDCILYRSVTS